MVLAAQTDRNSRASYSARGIFDTQEIDIPLLLFATSAGPAPAKIKAAFSVTSLF
jgi:hypothetical protein